MHLTAFLHLRGPVCPYAHDAYNAHDAYVAHKDAHDVCYDVRDVYNVYNACGAYDVP